MQASFQISGRIEVSNDVRNMSHANCEKNMSQFLMKIE